MAHESALTQSSNLKDGEESVTEADLEEGEIEDGELPEEGEVQTPDDPPCIPKASQSPKVPIVPLPVKKERRAPLLPRPPRRHPPQNLRRHVAARTYREPPLVNNESETEDDDWASKLEKALKAALAGSEGATGPTVTSTATGEAETKSSAVSENDEKEGNRSSSDDERRLKKKKRKKKNRDDGDEEDNKRDLKKRRKTHHKDMWEEKDEQGDEDEMLFVRGASPTTRNNYSEGSPSRNFGENSFYPDQGAFDDAYDSFHEEGSDFEARDDFPIRRGGGGRGSEEDGLRHGIGRGGKRRMRGGPLGRGGDINQRGAHHHLGKRMLQNRKDGGIGKNSGKLRGGFRRVGGRDVCMFFLQGKCHKGADCPYSHDAMQSRKNELCKFYLKDCCAKKDKCLYLHEAFPCKFFHTGMKCYQGDQCKFSHGPLSNQMRNVLMKHLETASKDLLNDYPRGGRESSRRRDNERSDRSERNDREREREKEKDKERGEKADKGERSEKSERGERSSAHRPGNGSTKRASRAIPSLFDIEVPIHVQRLAERKDADGEDSPARRSTPMPESENEDGIDTPVLSSKSETKSSRNKENRWVSDNSQSSVHNRDFNGDKTPDRKSESKSQNEGEKLTFRFYQDTLSSDEGEHRKRDDHRRKREHKSKRESHHKHSKHSTDLASDASHKSKSSKKTVTDEDTTVSDEKQKQDSQEEKVLQLDILSESRDSQAETGESGTESNDGANIPLHLPKKQRELFLRIQQQQREADSSQDRSGDNEEDEENCADENWYSSDEEDVPLTDLLKKLSNQAPQKETTTQNDAQQSGSTPPQPLVESAPPVIPTVSGLTLEDLSQIDISESVTKLLTTIRNQGVIPSTKTTTTTAAAAPTATMTMPITSSVLTSTATVTAPTPERSPATTAVQSPQQQGSPVIRDPRVSRDPRNRPPATATTCGATLPVLVTSGPQGLLSPGSSSNSISAEVPVHPARRPDPRTVRADPRKAAAAAAAAAVTSVGASPSADDCHSKNTVAGPPPRRASFTSIYSNAITSPGDVDLRSLPRISTTTAPSTPATGDVDLRHVVDTDLRQIAGFSGDTDLRPRIPAEPSGALSGDIDLRRVLELPFKPVPMHTPATEIDASLTSHPPIPYKVVEITIPRPDYTRLKLSTADPQVENDPRLRKIFKLPELPVTTTTSSSKTSTSFSPSVPRMDPRRLANPGSVSTATTSVKSTVSHSSVVVTSATVAPTTEPLPLGIAFGNVSDPSVPSVGIVMPGVGTVANVDPRVPRTAPVTCRPGLLGVAPPGFPVASNPAIAVGMRMPFFPIDESDGNHWNPLQAQQQRPSWRGMRRNVAGAYSEQDMASGQTFTPPL